MSLLKLQNYSRRRCMKNINPGNISWQNGSASAGTFSQRRTFGSRWCILSPKGYIKNDNFECTLDPTEALQWVSKDVLIRILKDMDAPENCFTPVEIHYDREQRAWLPVTTWRRWISLTFKRNERWATCIRRAKACSKSKYRCQYSFVSGEITKWDAPKILCTTKEDALV